MRKQNLTPKQLAHREQCTTRMVEMYHQIYLRDFRLIADLKIQLKSGEVLSEIGSTGPTSPIFSGITEEGKQINFHSLEDVSKILVS